MTELWKLKSVDEICERISVGIVVQPAKYYVDAGHGIRAFRSANVAENRIVDDNWVYLSAEGHASNAKSCLKTGDVLVVRSGAPGTACVVTPEFDGTNCIDVVFARPNPKFVLPEYLSEYTNSAAGKQHVLGNKGGLALQHFNASAYREMFVLLPPVPEQHKIVGILRTWDAAIEKLEALWAAKERQLLALTNALVFGKMRLQRFRKNPRMSSHRWFALPSDWKCHLISDVATEISERNHNNERSEVLSCLKSSGFVRSLEYFKKQVYSSDLRGYKKIWRMDFGFPSNHVEEGSIGVQDIAEVGLVSPIYTVFRFNPGVVNPLFAFAVLKTEVYRHIFEVSTSASVDRRGSLRWGEFKTIPFPVPSIAEQTAIVDVLKTAKSERDKLLSQLEAVRFQKRGLTQKLLTGQIRVPDAAVSLSPAAD